MEVEVQIKTWMSLIQSIPQESRLMYIPETILLGKDNFFNPPPPVWDDPSVQCYSWKVRSQRWSVWRRISIARWQKRGWQGWHCYMWTSPKRWTLTILLRSMKELRIRLIWILILDGGSHLNLLCSHCALVQTPAGCFYLLSLCSWQFVTSFVKL